MASFPDCGSLWGCLSVSSSEAGRACPSLLVCRSSYWACGFMPSTHCLINPARQNKTRASDPGRAGEAPGPTPLCFLVKWEVLSFKELLEINKTERLGPTGVEGGENRD